MREIQSSEAKAHLPQILDDAHRKEEVDRTIVHIKTLQTEVGPISLNELLSARHEGHRY